MSAGLVFLAVAVAIVGLLMSLLLRVKLGPNPKTAWTPARLPPPPPLPRSYFVLKNVGWGLYAAGLVVAALGGWSVLPDTAAHVLL